VRATTIAATGYLEAGVTDPNLIGVHRSNVPTLFDRPGSNPDLPPDLELQRRVGGLSSCSNIAWLKMNNIFIPLDY